MPDNFGGEKPTSNIVTLADFRSYVATSAPDEVTREANYQEYHATKYVLGRLGMDSSPSLVIKWTRSDESGMLKWQRGNHLSIYGLTINSDEEEQVTLDLNQQEPEFRDRLRPRLGSYYVAMSVAAHILANRDLLDTRARLSAIHIDNEIVRLNSEERKLVTEWRVASGLGILAVARDDIIQSDMRKYLESVLRWRHQYAMNLANLRYWKITHKEPPADASVSHRLLGIGNPLGASAIKRILQKPHQ